MTIRSALHSALRSRALRRRLRRLGVVCARSASLVALLSLVTAAYLSVGRIRAEGRLLPPPLALSIPLWSLDRGLSPSTSRPAKPLFEIRAVVTGYSSTVAQTDSTPWITAANTRVRPGVVALSRDLLREFTPGAPFGFGDMVEIRGVGAFLVEDTMSSRFRRRADIWFESKGEAIRWGRQHRTLVKLLPPDGPFDPAPFPRLGRRGNIHDLDPDPPRIFEAALSD